MLAVLRVSLMGGIFASLARAQPHNADPIDPRHHLDARCPRAVTLDPSDKQRDPASSSSYLWSPLPASATVEDCAKACCGDWSCEAFAFYKAQNATPALTPTPAGGSLTGDWIDHDSLRGVSHITLKQSGRHLTAISLQPRASMWGAAAGFVNVAGTGGYLYFGAMEGHHDVAHVQNNRTFTLSADHNTIFLERLSFDPVGFTQNFTRSAQPFGPGGNCTSATMGCCVFKDDLDALVANPPGSGVLTGRRAKLPARPPPYPNSTVVKAVVLHPKMEIGINGDEFPITWDEDGNMYTGAGDNSQPGESGSPLSFFRVQGGPTEMGCSYPPTHGNQPSPNCSHIKEMGAHVPVQGPDATKACPAWNHGIPNLKSSGVLSLDGVLYWAISCFNYGDDPVFNRQRYGPAWIVTSADKGKTWNLTATPTDMFPGRLAAPRFVQYGQDYNGAPDDWVYVYFPGTQGDSAFFENNDQVLLARVDKRKILDRNSYEFFNGVQLDGSTAWTTDSTIATAVWQFPLMTSVQQANYHPGLKRYIFANWAWISYDGYPRPDHTADEKNSRTGHQRTQLSLVEAPHPWGPFSIMYRDDDWSGIDLAGERSVGGYTPVIPPAWVGNDDFWIVFTQCCGNPRPPLNNYNFNAQHITFTLADADAEIHV